MMNEFLKPLRQILTLRPKDRSTAIKEGDIFHQSHSDAQSKNIWRGNIVLMVTQYQSYDERILKALCAKFLSSTKRSFRSYQRASREAFFTKVIQMLRVKIFGEELLL